MHNHKKKMGELITGTAARIYDLSKLVSFGWRVNWILARLLPTSASGTLLDLGCGTGTLLVRLSKYNEELVLSGIEPSKDMLKIAKEKLAGTAVDLIESGAEKLPFQDESFDYLTCSLVFHHLPEEAQNAALSEAWRVLKPGGYLYFADIGQTDTWFKKIIGFSQRDHAYSRGNMEGELDRRLRSSAFKSCALIYTAYLPWSSIDFYRLQKEA